MAGSTHVVKDTLPISLPCSVQIIWVGSNHVRERELQSRGACFSSAFLGRLMHADRTAVEPADPRLGSAG